MKTVFLFLFFIPAVCYSSVDNVPSGSRSAGIAGSSVTLVDAWSGINNPAGLAWLSNIEFSASGENRFAMRGMNNYVFVFATPFKYGSAAVSWSQNGNSLFCQQQAGLSYALLINKNISAGINLNYAQVKIANGYGNRSVFNAALGIHFKINSSLRFGVHVLNPSRARLTDEPKEYLPSLIRSGFSYHFSDNLFIITEVEKDLEHEPVLRNGLEYKIHPAIVLRVGFMTNPFIYTFGVGIKHQKINFDLAAGMHQLLGLSSQAGFTYTFDSK